MLRRHLLHAAQCVSRVRRLDVRHRCRGVVVIVIPSRGASRGRRGIRIKSSRRPRIRLPDAPRPSHQIVLRGTDVIVCSVLHHGLNRTAEAVEISGADHGFHRRRLLYERRVHHRVGTRGIERPVRTGARVRVAVRLHNRPAVVLDLTQPSVEVVREVAERPAFIFDRRDEPVGVVRDVGNEIHCPARIVNAGDPDQERVVAVPAVLVVRDLVTRVRELRDLPEVGVGVGRLLEEVAAVLRQRAACDSGRHKIDHGHCVRARVARERAARRQCQRAGPGGAYVVRRGHRGHAPGTERDARRRGTGARDVG